MMQAELPAPTDEQLQQQGAKRGRDDAMRVLSSADASVVFDFDDDHYAVIGGRADGGEERVVDLRVKVTLFRKDAVQKDELPARLATPTTSAGSATSASSSEPAAKKSKTSKPTTASTITSTSTSTSSSSSSSSGGSGGGGAGELVEVGSLYLANYSSKSVALFGESKPIKEHLLELGGKFNNALLDPKSQQRTSGWIFDIGKKDLVVAHLLEKEATGSFPAVPDAPAADPSVAKTALKGDCYLVNYSDKCVAVFGATKGIKDELKALKGRYNGFLKDPTIGGAVAPGWIFPMKEKDALIKKLGKKGGVVAQSRNESKAEEDAEEEEEDEED